MPGAIRLEDIPVEPSPSTEREFVSAVEESPLASEALLSRPESADAKGKQPANQDGPKSLSALLSRFEAVREPTVHTRKSISDFSHTPILAMEPGLERLPTTLAKLTPGPSETPVDQEEGPSAQLVESPLVNEPLLRPRSLLGESKFDFGRSLSDHLASLLPKPEPLVLNGSFVSDMNIPDGQFFPPGAEFVKSWRMKNDGEAAWPETTEIVFVAGDRLASRDQATVRVKVGSVAVGEEVEIVAGEMKAPDVPGKYVSYWRLSDGEGKFFGHSVWIDINVAEMNKPASRHSGEGSLDSSTVIMPQSVDASEHGSSSVAPPASVSSVTIPSNPPSDDGSFDSSVSLIEVPSDDEDDAMYEDAMYEDSRSRVIVSPVPRARELDYVVLYDTSSSGED